QAPPNSLKCFVTFGCQSRVKMTGRLRRWNKAIVRFVRGMIVSPPGTPRAPPGQKSFWTSTTSNAALSPMVPPAKRMISLKACALGNLRTILEIVVTEGHVLREVGEPARLDDLMSGLKVAG